MLKLRDMKGLGLKTEQQLQAIGVNTPDELKRMGAVPVFLALQRASDKPVSLNFLYALVGAIEDRHWQEVAKQEKSRLIQELEGYKEFHKHNQKSGPDFIW